MPPDRIRGMFLDEFQELVANLSAGLLALENGDTTGGIVNELFRAAHSLKGAAQATGARPVADVAHGMESVLSAIRHQTLVPSDDVLSALFVAADWLAAAAARMTDGGEPDARAARTLRGNLTQVASPDDTVPPQPGDEALPSAESSPGPSQQRSTAPSARDADSVRVPAAKLDTLVRHAADITAARQRVDTLRRDIAGVAASITEHDNHWRNVRARLTAATVDGQLPPDIAALLEQADASWRAAAAAAQPLSAAVAVTQRELRQSVSGLFEHVLDLRTMPFAMVCEGLERVVRDLTHRSDDKRVKLTVHGALVELDRSVGLSLRDPLIHLVNNAFDHGIEPAAERTRVGKSEVGHITLAAELRGGRVEIRVEDDGAGLRFDAVRGTAAQAEGSASAEDLVEAVFAPGFTTAAVVTETSGRGVGLDAVRSRIEGLGGTVQLVTRSGVGTIVTLVAPTTLSVVHALTVGVGDQVVIVPSSGVHRVLRIQPSDVTEVGGRPTFPWDGRHVPLVSLADLLGWESRSPAPEDQLRALLINSGGTYVALTVSTLLGEGDVPVHHVGDRVAEAPGVLGASLLPDGGIALILNPAAFARVAVEASPSVLPDPHVPQTAPARIVLAEDTLTTRVLEQGILEAAGYEVVPAADGADAWEQLQRSGADLVVSDVDMPRMNGLQLCAEIRRSRRFADLPVVLVTSLADDEDRRRGLEMGANAYIVKSGFDRGVLLETIARLLP